MRRLFVFIACLTLSVHASAMTWASVNYDKRLSAHMVEAFGLQELAEVANKESVQKILDHYTSAEMASAGIFSSKWLDRQAMMNAGPFGTAEENFYYTRICRLVTDCIRPKLWSVGSMLVKHPEKALYWGPYLYKTCNDVVELCMQFETIVTNGKLTFHDLAAQGAFLVVGDDLAALFDLAKLGTVDWSAVWEHLVSFGSEITKEDIKEDLEGLITAGGAIASAGGAVLDSVWTNGSKVGDVFHSKPAEIIDLYHQFRDMYETFSDPTNIKNLVMSHILSADSTGVSRLFTTSGYNITSYVSDYLAGLQNRYYTQRYYITRAGSVKSQIVNYYPPRDDYSILYNSQWYRRMYSGSGDGVTEEDQRKAKINSENYVGWSTEKVNQLNNSNNDYVYSIYYSAMGEPIHKENTYEIIGIAFAYAIQVYRAMKTSEAVYEEVFDSQYNHLDAFRAKMNGKLQELNDNERGVVYELHSDDKVYYNATDASHMAGCAAASFLMECNEEKKLSDGSFSWKENGNQKNGLDESSKTFAMNYSQGAPDPTSYDGEIERLGNEIRDYQSQKERVEQHAEQTRQEILDTTDPAKLKELENTLKELENSIEYFSDLLDNVSSQYDECIWHRHMLEDDINESLDGSYRIPGIMAALHTAYNIEWSDAGRWDGYTFVRHGTMENVGGELVFKAVLSMSREESWFWFVRYHRAILAVDWSLYVNYSSSEIVDYMELDPSMPDDEKAQAVNQRAHELRNEHPGCTIEENLAYSSTPAIEDDDDAIHLLWVCDRLKVAREVDHRLSKIYAELVLLEKYLRTKESLLDLLRNVLDVAVLDVAGRTRIGGRSYRFWRRAARGAAEGKSPEEVIAESNSKED